MHADHHLGLRLVLEDRLKVRQRITQNLRLLTFRFGHPSTAESPSHLTKGTLSRIQQDTTEAWDFD
jgi:hypothetical protein